ncbi:GNAT family N-acetyltransferase [Flavimaricola marinus]|uniref:Putative N-acetyltransferase YsnE n=1 Tax=Flavimaricola marinus TaxID=1819565 RepID=A0A238LAR0_9RHOB|nr:GNAT family N-acetyltransferase [Flavimaricola marinus]SMY06514.1 putative N-acetyltransferase YsnE [Flavimaricola marinus]
MSVTVRKGDPRSADGTALLQASHDYLSSLYPPEHNHYLSIDALCTDDITFLIAERDGKATGCAALKRFDGYGEVKSMFVDPGARGSGTGAALMGALEAEARAQGLGLLRLETGDDLYPAHRLYQRHGFTLCGPFGDYVEGPHSIFMERQL